MKIKKIVSIILLLFIALTTFTPLANAVTFNGSTKVNFPWIQWVWQYFGENIDGKELWTTKEDERINNVTSMVCIENWPEDSCLTYVMNVTQFFVIDLKKKYTNNENIWGITLTESVRNYISFNVWENNEKWERWENDIYFNYEIWEKKGNLVKISRNQKCGTENPNICVIGLNTFITYSAKGVTRGVYWTYSDVTVYSDENDNIRVHRSHKDKTDGVRPWFFQNALQNIAQYKGWYGARVGDIDSGTNIFISDKIYTDNSYENDKREIIYMKVDKWYWRFLKFEQYTRLSPEKIPKLWANGATLGQKNWEIYEKSRVLIPLMNEYLWDKYSQLDENTKLNVLYTLRDAFNFKWTQFSEHKGTSANPRNHDGYKDDEWYFICETTEIWCHIKNLGISIGKFFGNIWNWFADIIKGIFSWIWEGIKIITLPIQELFIKIKNTIKQVFGFIQSIFIRDLNEHQKISCDANFNFAITEEERKKADLKFAEYVEENFSWVMDWVFAFSNNFITIIRFIDPVIPANWSEICTYAWVKRVNYSTNSFIDVFFVMIFVLGIISLFFYRNS